MHESRDNLIVEAPHLQQQQQAVTS